MTVFGVSRQRDGFKSRHVANMFCTNTSSSWTKPSKPFEIPNFKLSAMDVLARTTMKDAANCDTQCELQNSVNHQTAERKRRRQGFFLAARLFQCFCIATEWDHQSFLEACMIRIDWQQRVLTERKRAVVNSRAGVVGVISGEDCLH